jgi:hypothetical protein
LRTKKQLHLYEGQTAFWPRPGLSWHVTSTLELVVLRAAPDQIVARRSVWMWWQTSSTVACVVRSASIRRFAAKVSVWTRCLTRKTVGAAATSARKGVHVSMECAAMHRNPWLHACSYISTWSGTKQVEICSLNWIWL